jgi:predicted MFS family arabinose efflux permease
MKSDQLISLSTVTGDGTTANYLTRRRTVLFLFALLLVSALCQIDRILPFILAESMKRDLGFSDTQLGLITGLAFAVCHSLMTLPLARVADRNSPKLVLTVCLLFWSVMTALGGLSSNVVFLALSRLGVAAGEAGAVPSGHALIVREVDPRSRGIAIGIFSMGIPLGAMLGFGVGGWVSDHFGWRAALCGAGALGWLLALLVMLVVRSTPKINVVATNVEPFFRSALRLFASPTFVWLFVAANFVGLASAPFYSFATPFLIRIHGLTASEAGATFGLLQGGLGIVGTILAGRGFDRAVQSGGRQLLVAPAVVFLASSFTLLFALFTPASWLTIVLFIPTMFAFSFLLPWAFGSAHLIAGAGKEALASSLVLIGSGLLGPTLGPLTVGMISDAVTAAHIADGLRWGMLFIPLACICAGIAMLVANQKLSAFMHEQRGQGLR